MQQDDESGSGPDYRSNYLIVRPHRGGFRDLFRYGVRGDEMSKAKFLERPKNNGLSMMLEAEDHRLVIVVSFLVRKIIALLRTPMEYTGFFVDFFLNLLSEIGGFFGLLLRHIQEADGYTSFYNYDKQKNANLIVISSRGTEPFDADDWGTDFDYSWYEIPNVGKLHMGFLEAMDLGNRNNTPTFHYSLFEQSFSEEKNDDKEKLDMVKKSAYYAVRTILKRLLLEHENAQFVVTGHSLGGALTILFLTLLVLKEETEIMKRLLGVYTFVPRLPYDDKTFLYKHFGLCLYYDIFYKETKAEGEPNPNPYGMRYEILGHVNAVWEVVRGLTMGYTHGSDYKEGWFRILFRLIGLLIPGLPDHCTTDYVNSVRLGQDYDPQMSSL